MELFLQNSSLWDWQYSMEHSKIFSQPVWMWGIFHEIHSVPWNIVYACEWCGVHNPSVENPNFTQVPNLNYSSTFYTCAQQIYEPYIVYILIDVGT